MENTTNILAPEKLSRREAAVDQIAMAIHLWKVKEYACSITLALAAEDQLPEPAEDKQYMFKHFKEQQSKSDVKIDANKIRNWLKHYKEPDEIEIREFDVIFALFRACTKFLAAHQMYTEDMKEFLVWMKQSGIYESNRK